MTTRQRSSRTPGHFGFTLLEVLVAMALFAVLATLSWRGLDAVLRARAVLVDASEDLDALSLGMVQLEEDVRRSWPARLRNPGVPALGFAPPAAPGASQSLQMLREVSGGSAGTLQRVVWRLRDGRLERGFAPWIGPTAGAGEGPAWTWQPLAANLGGLEMRGFVSGSGWVSAAGLAAGVPIAPGSTTAQPITGVEVTVVRTDGTRVLRVFPVRD
jgi:general secretion pathway protein J